jgi:hypothetical protein
MLRRVLATLWLVPLAALLTGCSALTKPDEIRIVAESITIESGPAAKAPTAGAPAAAPGGG